MRRLIKLSISNFKNPDQNVTSHTFSILVNTSELYTKITDPSYQIDPVADQIMINITNLNLTMSSGNDTLLIIQLT